MAVKIFNATETNYTGTLDADLIIGNNLGNFIDGSDGNDAIFGGGGNDVLIGGEVTTLFLVGRKRYYRC